MNNFFIADCGCVSLNLLKTVAQKASTHSWHLTENLANQLFTSWHSKFWRPIKYFSENVLPRYCLIDIAKLYDLKLFLKWDYVAEWNLNFCDRKQHPAFPKSSRWFFFFFFFTENKWLKKKKKKPASTKSIHCSLPRYDNLHKMAGKVLLELSTRQGCGGCLRAADGAACSMGISRLIWIKYETMFSCNSGLSPTIAVLLLFGHALGFQITSHWNSDP